MKRDREERWFSLLLGIASTSAGLILPVSQWLTGRILCDRRAICPDTVEIDGWFYLHLLMQSAIFLIPGILGIYHFLRKR